MSHLVRRLVVLLTAALPAVGLVSAAGAATAGPQVTCVTAIASCASPYATLAQGYQGTLTLTGSGFANDAALGGVVTVTTTAPGVTLTDAAESSATQATVDVAVASSATPGWYPLTFSDSAGSTTLSLGLAVNPGPQATSTTGATGAAGGATSTVTVTGTSLSGATVSFSGSGPTVAGTPVATATSLTFSVLNSSATAGTYTYVVTTPALPGSVPGSFTGTYVVTANSLAPTITAISPTTLAIPTTGGTVGNSLLGSSNTITITGTGFTPGATVTIAGQPLGVVLASSAYVSATSMTANVVVNQYSAGTTATAAGQFSVTVNDTNALSVTATNAIGVGMSGQALGSTAPVAPTITLAPGASLTPGTSLTLSVTASSSFPLTTSSQVSLIAPVSGNASETLTGTVLSVAGNVAVVRVVVPRYATTTLATASTSGATSLSLTSTAGMPTSGTVILADGTSTESVAYSAITGSTLTTSPAGAHAAGTLVEFPFPTGAYTLSISNGANVETAQVTVNAAPAASFTVGTSPLTNAAPSTLSVRADIPGFTFASGASIYFPGSTPSASSLVGTGITGTISGTGPSATLSVTIPATAPVDTTLAAAATPAQSTVTLTAVSGLTAGSRITIGPDATYTTPETVTVTSVTGNTVAFTPALADNHSNGALVTGLSQPQATSGAVPAVILNGAGQAFPVSALFTLASPTATTASPSTLGQGASSFPLTIALTSNTDLTPANWVVSAPGVTFATPTSATASALVVPFTVASTATLGAVTITATDGQSVLSVPATIVAGITATAITTTAPLTAGGSLTAGLTGTNFDLTWASNTCAVDNAGVVDPALTCSVTNTASTDSATSLTISVTAGAGALNGSDAVVVTDTATGASATLTGAVTVTGQPAVTAVTPATLVAQTSGTLPSISVTGTALSITGCSLVDYQADGSVRATSPTTCSLVSSTATSAQLGLAGTLYAGDHLDITLTNATSSVALAAIPVTASLTQLAVTPSSLAPGSTSVPVVITGDGFLASTTVSVPAADGTITVTAIYPSAILATVTLPAGLDLSSVPVTVANTDGTSAILSLAVSSAPTITGTYAGLEGTSGVLVLTGTGFVSGATVTSSLPSIITLGTAVASNCAGTLCTTLSVPVTYATFTGTSTLTASLTITNPAPYGSATVAGALVVYPTPAVTGTYYVAPSTSNLVLTVTGYGFQSGLTAVSSNAAFSVSVVAVTPTSVSLLVTTTAAATTGTSSQVTLTNPNTGTVAFALHGGTAPVPVTRAVIRMVHPNRVARGRASIIVLRGLGLGNAHVVSDSRLVSVQVLRSASGIIVVRVIPARTAPSRVYHLIVRTATDVLHVGYSVTLH